MSPAAEYWSGKIWDHFPSSYEWLNLFYWLQRILCLSLKFKSFPNTITIYLPISIFFFSEHGIIFQWANSNYLLKNKLFLKLYFPLCVVIHCFLFNLAQTPITWLLLLLYIYLPVIDPFKLFIPYFLPF